MNPAPRPTRFSSHLLGPPFLLDLRALQTQAPTVCSGGSPSIRSGLQHRLGSGTASFHPNWLKMIIWHVLICSFLSMIAPDLGIPLASLAVMPRSDLGAARRRRVQGVFPGVWLFWSGLESKEGHQTKRSRVAPDPTDHF